MNEQWRMERAQKVLAAQDKLRRGKVVTVGKKTFRIGKSETSNEARLLGTWTKRGVTAYLDEHPDATCPVLEQAMFGYVSIFEIHRMK